MKLVIANIDIHQDAEGRYSLNDLHVASGGNAVHAPGQFLRNQQTMDLIAAIDAENPTVQISAVKTKEGRYGGSYGAKEIVYAYAMWISPKFHLQVIRTFDALVTGDVEKAKQLASQGRQQNPTGATRAHLMCVSAMVKMGVRKELAMAVAMKAIHDDTGLTTEGYRLALPSVEDVCNLNQTQLGEIAGLSSVAIGKKLRAAGFLEDDESGNRVVTEKGKQFGEMKPFTNNGHAGYEPRWREEVLETITQGALA